MFPSWWDEKSTLIVIDCGIDESRTAGKSILVVSAIIGQTANMRKLARAWQKRLNDNGVDFFHAKDHWNLRAKPYHGLSKTKREILLAKLIEQIHKRAEVGLSVAIDVKEYEKITTPKFRSDFGAPYAFAVQQLMMWIYADLKKRNRLHEDVNVLIEDGSHVRQAHEIFTKAKDKGKMYFNLSSWGLGGKNNPILQAADLLAYGCCQYVSNGDSVMYRQLANTGSPRFMHLLCNADWIDSIKMGVEAEIQQKREFRIAKHPLGDGGTLAEP